MNVFSKELSSKLLTLQQRKLTNGELFLLAKAIADSLPLPPIDVDSISLYTISKRSKINDIIYSLQEYTYLNDEEIKVIYRLIDELTLWRYNIAYSPPNIVFRTNSNLVIDDISCLPRYIDMTYLCAVADIVDNANWMYNLFKDVVKEIGTK